MPITPTPVTVLYIGYNLLSAHETFWHRDGAMDNSPWLLKPHTAFRKLNVASVGNPGKITRRAVREKGHGSGAREAESGGSRRFQPAGEITCSYKGTRRTV